MGWLGEAGLFEQIFRRTTIPFKDRVALFGCHRGFLPALMVEAWLQSSFRMRMMPISRRDCVFVSFEAEGPCTWHSLTKLNRCVLFCRLPPLDSLCLQSRVSELIVAKGLPCAPMLLVARSFLLF